jgi:L-rhamnose isomerase
MHLCIDCISIHAYSSSQASQQGLVEAARMLPGETRKARNIGKDAIKAMARTPGSNGKDADAL